MNDVCGLFHKADPVAVWEYEGIAEDNLAFIFVKYYCPYCGSLVAYKSIRLWG